jgi:hypothetical protein
VLAQNVADPHDDVAWKPNRDCPSTCGPTQVLPSQMYSASPRENLEVDTPPSLARQNVDDAQDTELKPNPVLAVGIAASDCQPAPSHLAERSPLPLRLPPTAMHHVAEVHETPSVYCPIGLRCAIVHFVPFHTAVLPIWLVFETARQNDGVEHDRLATVGKPVGLALDHLDPFQRSAFPSNVPTTQASALAHETEVMMSPASRFAAGSMLVGADHAPATSRYAYPVLETMTQSPELTHERT